jgi:hypothetical protein
MNLFTILFDSERRPVSPGKQAAEEGKEQQ